MKKTNSWSWQFGQPLWLPGSSFSWCSHNFPVETSTKKNWLIYRTVLVRCACQRWWLLWISLLFLTTFLTGGSFCSAVLQLFSREARLLPSLLHPMPYFIFDSLLWFFQRKEAQINLFCKKWEKTYSSYFCSGISMSVSSFFL